MQQEASDKRDEQTARFRDQLFALAYGTSNPEMFRTLFPDVFGVEDESEIDWEVPDDPMEFESMMDELRETGYHS